MSDEAMLRDLSGAEDEALVRFLQESPPESERQRAATELFGRYQRRVYVWCLRMVRDHDQALDLAQDVQLNAYRALGSFRASSRFSSWLFAIARNRCLSALRPVSLTRDEDAELEHVADSQRGVDQVLEEAQGEQRLLALIQDALDPLEQQALTLRCFERVSVDEITRRLNLDTSSGARGLLQRARRKLRAALDAPDRGEEP